MTFTLKDMPYTFDPNNIVPMDTYFGIHVTDIKTGITYDLPDTIEFLMSKCPEFKNYLVEHRPELLI